MFGMLLPLAASLIGGMIGGKKKKGASASQVRSGGGQSPLDTLLAAQLQRYKQNDPLQQALIAESANLLPTHMKRRGTQTNQWQKVNSPMDAVDYDPSSVVRPGEYAVPRDPRSVVREGEYRPTFPNPGAFNPREF